MYTNIKILLPFLFLIFFLTGCLHKESSGPIENIDSQSTDKGELQPEENKLSTRGYVQTIDSEQIWVTMEASPTTKFTGVIVDITGLQEETISKLKVGQKVKVINYSQMIYSSNPAREKADAIEIISE